MKQDFIYNFFDSYKGFTFYPDALNTIIENDYKIPCAVYTSEGYDATGPISGAGYYYDGAHICYGEYYKHGVDYHKLTKKELFYIQQHHKTLEKEFNKNNKKR